MNKKTLIAAAALAVASASGFAIEAEQIAPEASSSLTREEVRAEMRQLKDLDALPEVTEASPSQLEATEAQERISQFQVDQQFAQWEAEQQLALMSQNTESVPAENAIDPLRAEDQQYALMSYGADNTMYVVPTGTVVIIEAVPVEGSATFDDPVSTGEVQ
jgi:hypothetical protein